VTPDQVAFYVDLFKKVRATPEWKEFMEKGAFNQTFMTGKEYRRLGGEGRGPHAR
jgi:putative tricarboxylic transport membrane protein